MGRVIPFRNRTPRLGPRVFLAESATVIGDVVLAEDVGIWFGAVLRGDVGWIRIGARSNVQDLSTIHMTTDLSNTELGAEVTVGHNAILHGARVGDGALIGMGAILLDNCEIGEEALVAAGTLVPGGMVVPPRTLVRGSPGRVVRDLRPDEWGQGREGALRYVELAASYRSA